MPIDHLYLQPINSFPRKEMQQQRVKQMSAHSFSNSWIAKNNAMLCRIDHNYAWSPQPAELKINVQHEGVVEVSSNFQGRNLVPQIQ